MVRGITLTMCSVVVLSNFFLVPFADPPWQVLEAIQLNPSVMLGPRAPGSGTVLFGRFPPFVYQTNYRGQRQQLLT